MVLSIVCVEVELIVIIFKVHHDIESEGVVRSVTDLDGPCNLAIPVLEVCVEKVGFATVGGVFANPQP